MSAEAEAEDVCYTIRGFRVLIKNDFEVYEFIGVHIEAKKEASKRPWIAGALRPLLLVRWSPIT